MGHRRHLASRPFPSGTAEKVQHWSLHPLGPAAEVLGHNVGPFGDSDDVLLNLWAARLDVDGVVEVTFDDCATYDVTPDELVGDDYTATQCWPTIFAPEGPAGSSCRRRRCPVPNASPCSAHRVIQPYLAVPPNLGECPTGHLSDAARPPAAVAPPVRWFGTPHPLSNGGRQPALNVALQDPLGSRR